MTTNCAMTALVFCRSIINLGDGTRYAHIMWTCGLVWYPLDMMYAVATKMRAPMPTNNGPAINLIHFSDSSSLSLNVESTSSRDLRWRPCWTSRSPGIMKITITPPVAPTIENTCKRSWNYQWNVDVNLTKWNGEFILAVQTIEITTLELFMSHTQYRKLLYSESWEHNKVTSCSMKILKSYAWVTMCRSCNHKDDIGRETPKRRSSK